MHELIQKTLLLLVLLVLSIEVFCQIVISEKNDCIPTIKYNKKDTVEEKYIMNLSKDTVFCILLDNKIDSIVDSNKFYIYEEGKWKGFDDKTRLTEIGKFGKWRIRNYFWKVLFRPKYWFWKQRKVDHKGKEYFPKVKVGQWDYCQSDQKVIETKIFNKFGQILH